MRYFLLPIMASVAFTLNAQDKGFISGNVGFDLQKYDIEGDDGDESLTNWEFSPAVGYNISPKHVVGLQLSLQGQTYEYKMFTGLGYAKATEKQTLFEAALFYRYMKSVGEKCSIYGQLKVGGGGGKSKQESEGSPITLETKISTMGVTIGPGVVYNIADRWALNADWGAIGYVSETHKVDGAPASSKETISDLRFGLDMGAISFGLNWLF